MSHRAARDLPTKIARAAHYDGLSLSIDTTNNSLERMEVRNGSAGLHLDLQNFEIWRFSAFWPHNNNNRQRDGLKSVLRVGGPIFEKATKVAITIIPV